MSSYKKEIYESFINRLGGDIIVDIQIHHYDPEIFNRNMDRAKGQYHFYAIMPHFFSDASPDMYLPVIESIHPEELLIIDKQIPLKGKFRCIYQDFKNDILEALQSNKLYLSKYSSVEILFPKGSHHPSEIINGVAEFAKQNQFRLVSWLHEIQLKKRSALHNPT